MQEDSILGNKKEIVELPIRKSCAFYDAPLRAYSLSCSNEGCRRASTYQMPLGLLVPLKRNGISFSAQALIHLCTKCYKALS